MTLRSCVDFFLNKNDSHPNLFLKMRGNKTFLHVVDSSENSRNIFHLQNTRI